MLRQPHFRLIMSLFSRFILHGTTKTIQRRLSLPAIDGRYTVPSDIPASPDALFS